MRPKAKLKLNYMSAESMCGPWLLACQFLLKPRTIAAVFAAFWMMIGTDSVLAQSSPRQPMNVATPQRGQDVPRGQDVQRGQDRGERVPSPQLPAATVVRGQQPVALPPLPKQSTPEIDAANARWIANQSPAQVPNSSSPEANHGGLVVQASAMAPLSAAQVAVQTANNRRDSGLRLPPPSEKNSQPESRGGTLQMLVSVGSSLLLVIGLFLGLAWCYRKTMNNSMGGVPKSVVSVLGRTQLAPRQQLMLVRFGSKLVLVSVIQGEARTISEITDPLEVDQLAGLCESYQPHSVTQSFRQILNQTGGAI